MDAKLAGVFQGFFYDAGRNTVEAMDSAAIAGAALKPDHTPCHPLGDERVFAWIDIVAPTVEELASLATRLKLDPQILEDLGERAR